MIGFSSVRTLALAAGIVSAVLLGTACGGDDTTTAIKTKAAESVTPGGAKTTAPATSTGDEKKVEISMKDNLFDPKDVTVPSGVKIKISAHNVGAAVHNMHVLSQDGEGKDYTSDTMVNPGKTSEFEVTFKKKGTYKFQCDFHVPDMVGTITVN